MKFLLSIFKILLLLPVLWMLTVYLNYSYVLPDVSISLIYVLNLKGLIIESIILFIFNMIVFLISKRFLFSCFFSVMFYLIFILSNIIKIKYLQTPLYPVDFRQIDDLLRTKEFYISFLPFLLLLVPTFFISKYIYFKSKISKFRTAARYLSILILSSSILLISIYKSKISNVLRDDNIYYRINGDLIKSSLKIGLLTNFMELLLLENKYSPPRNYSKQRILEIINRYHLNKGSNLISKDLNQPKNIILLLVESFTDPTDHGWVIKDKKSLTFSNVKMNHSQGRIISPVFGGKSINAEFELLTGLSKRYTPVGSMPYKEIINSNLPSIARTLSKNDYHTIAIQEVKMNGFGYKRIYQYLGFDEKISFWNREDLKRIPNNYYVTGVSMAKEMIKLLKHDKNFIFVFPNSTHAPWSYDPHGVKVIKQKRNVDYKKINGYIQSLFRIDEMLLYLINHFKNTEDNTLIIMLGDHQPHILKYLENDKNRYSVPVLIWSNYLKRKDRVNLSMNLLTSYILEKSNIEVYGLEKFIKLLRNYYSIISPSLVLKNNMDNNQILSDYETIEYDLLFGKKYFYDVLYK